jgi:hypothetical protein
MTMKLLAIAISAPLLLIGAADPETSKPDGAGPLPAQEAMAAPVTYRPCRPGPGDDRCIQLYERGVRASYARWLDQRGVGDAPTQVAMGGPAEESARSPRRHRQARSDATARHERSEHAAANHHGRETRCVESDGHGGETRGM